MARKRNYAVGGKAPGEAVDGVEAQGATTPHVDAAKGLEGASPSISEAPEEGGVLGALKQAGRFIRGADRYTSDLFGQMAGSSPLDPLKAIGKSIYHTVDTPAAAARGEFDPRDLGEGTDRVIDMATNIGGSALALPGEKGALGMFVGRRGTSYPERMNKVADEVSNKRGTYVDEYDLGKALKGDDALARQVWSDHAFGANRTQNPTDSLMYEIPDNTAVYKGQPAPPNRPNIKDFNGDMNAYQNAFLDWNEARLGMRPGGGSYTLKDVLDHPELYREMPELANTPVRFDPSLPDRHQGFFDRGSGMITLNPNLPMEQQLATALHETQHNIQHLEGWQGGANIEAGEHLTNQSRDRMNAVEGLKEIYDHLQDGKTPSWIKAQTAKGMLTGDKYSLEMAQDIIKQNPENHGAVVQGMYDKALSDAGNYRDPFQNYQRFDGEVQARNTAEDNGLGFSAPDGGEPTFHQTGRRNLDLEGRKANYWKDTEDYRGQDRILGGDIGQTTPFAQGGFIEGRNDNDGPKASARDLLAMPNRKGLNTWDAIKPPSPVKKPDLPLMGTAIRPANEYAQGGTVTADPQARAKLMAHLAMAKGGTVYAEPDSRMPSAMRKVVDARKQQMLLPVEDRTKATGEKLFADDEDAYKRTKDIVPQVDNNDRLAHIPPDRDVPDRLLPLIRNREAIARGIADDIAPSVKDGRSPYFYNNGPIYEEGMNRGIAPDETQGALRSLAPYMGATSSQTETMTNTRNATLLRAFDKNGIPYQGGDGGNLQGYNMMGSHLDAARRYQREGSDPETQPKHDSYGENFSGNLAPYTADRHKIKSTLIKLNQIEPGSIHDAYLDTKARQQYRQNPEALTGNMLNGSMGAMVLARGERAKAVDYPTFASIGRLTAHHLGIAPAEEQSAEWFHYGDKTGLKSPPMTLTELLNERINITAQALGLPQEKVWDMVRNGDIPLMKAGGAVRA